MVILYNSFLWVYHMDCIILNKVVDVWQKSGAVLSCEPKQHNYLKHHKPYERATLLLQFGVPRILYTLNYYYEIDTMKQGNVRAFVRGLLNNFNAAQLISRELETDEQLSLVLVQEHESLVTLI
jgi:hypothetical protein